MSDEEKIKELTTRLECLEKGTVGTVYCPIIKGDCKGINCASFVYKNERERNRIGQGEFRNKFLIFDDGYHTKNEIKIWKIPYCQQLHIRLGKPQLKQRRIEHWASYSDGMGSGGTDVTIEQQEDY